MRRWFAGVSILSAAFAFVAASDAVAAGGKCLMPGGWSEITRSNPRFIVFGESHGTREAPAFVGDVACALSARRERLLIAIELPSTENEGLQAAWRLPHRKFAAAVVKAGWRGRTDGVASQAMLDLVVRLHALKAAGRSISVVAFSGPRDEAQRAKFRDLPGQGPHEAAQAENIRVAAEARPFDHVIVLVGNFHARKQPFVRGQVSFKPMAMELAAPGQVVSLNMATAGGTAWNCTLRPGVAMEAGKPMPGDAIECGNHPQRGIADLNRPSFMAMGSPSGASDSSYDGYFWLGRVIGSPPVGQ